MTNEAELFARVSTLEFAIETFLANALSQGPPEFSEQFRKDFVARFKTPVLGDAPQSSAGEQIEAWICERSGQIAEALMKKVEARESEIRAGR